MKLLRVAPDRWNFQDEDGNYFMPFGGNMLNDVHPREGTLFDHFDADDTERRFAAMQAHGLNCLRQAIGVNHVYDAHTGLKADGMRNWHRFIELAEQYGVRLMPVGGYLGSNDWFDAHQLANDGQPLDDSCAFWAAFVNEFKGHPAIFSWDLRNELLYAVNQHMANGDQSAETERLLLSGWPAYLQTRYGSLAAMNAAYGNYGPFSDYADVPSFVQFKDDPGNPIAFDFRNYLNEKGYRWSKRQVDVIRATSPEHMVCSGNNGWLFPDMDLMLANGFHNIAHHDLYDFVSIHPYPAPQCLPTGHGDPLDGGEAAAFWFDAVVAMARIDYFNKPVVLQEFGWYGGGKSQFLCELPYRSEQEHADYTQALITRLLPHASGFISWPLCDMPGADDISDHGGMFTHDARPKALAETYHALAAAHGATANTRQPGTKVVTYSLLQLYTSRAYQDAMWEEIHALTRAGATLDFRFI